MQKEFLSEMNYIKEMVGGCFSSLIHTAFGV